MNKSIFSVTLVVVLALPLGSTPANAQYYTRPDFILTGMTVSPLQPAVNQSVTITVSGTYAGPIRYNTEGLSSLKSEFLDLFYDGSKTQGATFTVSASDPLNDGETFSYVYYGSFASGGEKRLTFTVDYAGETDEANEQNNRAEKTITVFDPFTAPNLSVTSVTATPSQAKVNEEVSFEITGKYTGSASLLSTQGIRALGRDMPDFVPSSGVTPVSPQPTESLPLASGGTFKYFVVGSFSASGIKEPVFTLDPLNELTESAENDNSISVVFSVAAEAETPALPPEEPAEEQPSPGEPPATEEEAVRERIRRLNLTITDQEREVIASARDAFGTADAGLISRLAGRILLQVEDLGRAWYLDPITRLRYYLKDGTTAYTALQAFGLGISSADLKKIPVGIEKRAAGTDSDADGLVDTLEQALGTDPQDTDSDNDGMSDQAEVTAGRNPLGSGTIAVDAALTQRLEGRILLQVEGQGQAWYVLNGKRYYMPNGEQAYQIMRFLSLGITNKDLNTVSVGSFEE